MKFFKIWMNQGIIHRQGRPGKCVFLCDLDWQLEIETSETKPRRASPVYPVYRSSPNKQWLCAGVFLPPLLVPLPYCDASTSPLKSFFDLPQLSVSLNVQIDRTVKYACFAGLDLRSGNTLTINELEKWCFEIIRT